MGLLKLLYPTNRYLSAKHGPGERIFAASLVVSLASHAKYEVSKFRDE
jgi:hypothetical protein